MDDLNLDEKRNAVLGQLDHLNSLVGLAKSYIEGREQTEILTGVQHDLFVLQAHIAFPDTYCDLPRARVFELQQETCVIEPTLAPLTHFIVPEGTTAACALHCVRTAARMIERSEPGYLEQPSILAMYMDRLACLTFAMARSVNQEWGIFERAPRYTTEIDAQN